MPRGEEEASWTLIWASDGARLRAVEPETALSTPLPQTEGGVMQGRQGTKEQLYREAKRLGIKGRSKMNKGQLKAAIDRRH
jgi:hypothetical protein